MAGPFYSQIAAQYADQLPSLSESRCRWIWAGCACNPQLEFFLQFGFQVFWFTDILLNYSDRAFFELARACLTCRSKFAPVLACTAASYTPTYEPGNIHMFREVMKTADIPKRTIRDIDDKPDPTLAPQCTLPPPHAPHSCQIQFPS